MFSISSQFGVIKEYLKKHRSEWVSLPRIMELTTPNGHRIANHTARISDLRNKYHHDIRNRTSFVSGVKCSWYRWYK